MLINVRGTKNQNKSQDLYQDHDHEIKIQETKTEVLQFKMGCFPIKVGRFII